MLRVPDGRRHVEQDLRYVGSSVLMRYILRGII